MMSLFKSKAHKENEIIAGSKSSTIKSFFGFNRDKPPPPPPTPTLVVSTTDKNNDPINVNSCNQISQPIIKTIHTTIPTFDMFQSPKFKTRTWPLRLLPQYRVYLLIYVRLENGQELLSQLYSDIHSYIDYYQPLDQGAILIHSKQPAFHYSMLKLTAPVFGIQMIVSNGDWLYSVHNYSLIRAFAEMNLQMVKFVPLKYPRIIITVLGIPTRVRRVQLVRFFKRIEKLVSYEFAPIGRTTKFHVIYLQYSRFSSISEITSKIRSCNKSIKFILRHDSLLQNAISTLISS